MSHAELYARVVPVGNPLAPWKKLLLVQETEDQAAREILQRPLWCHRDMRLLNELLAELQFYEYAKDGRICPALVYLLAPRWTSWRIGLDLNEEQAGRPLYNALGTGKNGPKFGMPNRWSRHKSAIEIYASPEARDRAVAELAKLFFIEAVGKVAVSLRLPS